MSKTVTMLVSVCILVAAVSAQCEEKGGLRLAVPFTDNMILQRQKPVPVWGFDTPGSRVTVEFAGQTKTATADEYGDWKVELDALEASFEPAEMLVFSSSDAGRVVRLGNVLVGEVWFSSGQSNMVWIAGKSMCAELANGLRTGEAEVPVREIAIDTISAVYPQKEATASENGWRTSRDAMQFSALSLSFAYELYKQLNVPVGILLSAHSNTRIEAFASRESFEAHPALEGDVTLIHEGDPLTPRGCDAFAQYYRDLETWQEEAIRVSKAGGTPSSPPNLPGIAGMWRGPSQFFSGKISPVVPYAIRGAIWCQGTSNSGDGRIYAARMEALVNGWRKAWGMPDMPFYFTQMQAYGSPEPAPDNLGFADVRQAQFLFFLNNRKNVGMVVQTDLNSARPQGIHYSNKLHPGMRLARWALAKQYEKNIAYTGPIYEGYRVDGNKAIVSFEKDSLFGGLMVGSKGMAADYREPEKFVEPARATPGEPLNHFRLCGEDRVWHAAQARIVGDTVVVTSDDVPKPVGVQYAYNAVPMNSNLYNQAGLPATPFAAVDGKLIFQEDGKATTTAGNAPQGTDAHAPVRPMLHVAEYYRNGAVVQRDRPIHVWGHANAGATVTVTLGDVVETTTANELEQWAVRIPAMKANADPITLTVVTDLGANQTVKEILVGDVWYLTGGDELSTEMAHPPQGSEAKMPDSLPLVREFKRNTKASTDATPRKRRFETGGGRFRSHWLPADYSVNDQGVTQFAYTFAKTLNRPGVPQGFITMSSGHRGMMASPLSWTSYAGVRDVTNPAFEARLNELLLQYPESNVARTALERHVAEVKACVDTILDIAKNGGDLSTAPRRFPGFPAPGQNPDVPGDTIPTYTYNWCVSPLTPMAVAGVIWVPSEYSIGANPSEYAAELEIYARSLTTTYGQETVPFLYAHPAPTLVKGIGEPDLPNAEKITFDAWPESLREIAAKMAARVAKRRTENHSIHH